MWEYTEKTREHFLNPRNVGVVEDADGLGEVGSLACGDALKLTFKLGSDGRIADASSFIVPEIQNLVTEHFITILVHQA